MSKPIGRDLPPSPPVTGSTDAAQTTETKGAKVKSESAPVEAPPKPVSPEVSSKTREAVAGDVTAALRQAELSKAVSGLKTPTAEQIKQIENCIKNGKKQEAIDLTIKYYGIDTSGVKGKVTYDSSVSGEGATNKERGVRMGDDAFKFGGKDSAAWLASSIMHESFHAKQIEERGTDWIGNDQIRHSYETEAYDKEIKEAKTTGLTDDMVNEVKRRRKDEHYDLLTTENKKKVDAGDYAGVK